MNGETKYYEPAAPVNRKAATLALLGAAISIIAVWLLAVPASSGNAQSPTTSDKRAAPLDLSAEFLQKPIVEKGTYTFGSRDTFSSALRYLGAPQDTITELLKKATGHCELDRVSKGQRMKYEIIEGIGLRELSVSCKITTRLRVNLDHGFTNIKLEDIPHRTREHVYACVVHKDFSLIGSASEVGISESQVMEVAHMFRSDIDFNNDIQPGDQLKILVNEVQDMEGNSLATGEVLAAQIISHGKEYWAIRYNGTDGKGYFDLKGWSLVKTFLRSPLPFLSVSSGFAFQRFHPILGKFRPHLGVDFRAPTGTPVMAAASGRVTEAGWEGGYGNVIKVQHGSLLTLYGHLSKIKVRRGQNVRQGQIIGSVGATGLATGPHLHYGMYRNNKAVDPLSVKMQTTIVLSSKNFRALRDHAVTVMKNTQPQNK